MCSKYDSLRLRTCPSNLRLIPRSYKMLKVQESHTGLVMILVGGGATSHASVVHTLGALQHSADGVEPQSKTR